MKPKRTAEEIYQWLKDQKYQTEQGEQEYKMYFDVDMPKIINAALSHFTSQSKEVTLPSDKLLNL